MANSPQARKRARQNVKRNLLRASQRSTMRTYIKRFLQAVQDKNIEQAKDAMRLAGTFLDKLAGKKVIHKNKAGRTKSRMAKRLKALEGQAAA